MREILERDPVGSSRCIVIEQAERLHPESTLAQLSSPVYCKADIFHVNPARPGRRPVEDDEEYPHG